MSSSQCETSTISQLFSLNLQDIQRKHFGQFLDPEGVPSRYDQGEEGSHCMSGRRLELMDIELN